MLTCIGMTVQTHVANNYFAKIPTIAAYDIKQCYLLLNANNNSERLGMTIQVKRIVRCCARQSLGIS